MGVDSNPFIKLPVIEWVREQKRWKQRGDVRFRVDDIMRYEVFHPDPDQISSPECRNEIIRVYYKRYAEQVNDVVVMRTSMMVVNMDLKAMDLLMNVY